MSRATDLLQEQRNAQEEIIAGIGELSQSIGTATLKLCEAISLLGGEQDGRLVRARLLQRQLHAFVREWNAGGGAEERGGTGFDRNRASKFRRGCRPRNEARRGFAAT